MAKKVRKTGTRKPTSGRPSAPASPPSGTAADDDDEVVLVQAPAAPRLSGVPFSPLMKSQERELEIGLTLTGLVCGALTGYSSVPFGSENGNLTAGVLGAVMGGMAGMSMGRSLFLSMRAQWFVWFVLAALSVGGYFVGGLIGAVVGTAAGTGFLFFGLRPLAMAAEKSRPGASDETATE